MRGKGTSVAPVYAGIRSDLDTLLTAFKQKHSVRFKFEEYLLRFSAVYMMSHRASYNADYPEPATEEDANATSARADRGTDAVPGPLLGPADGVNTLVEQVFGVYACYSFFCLQPTEYITQIRITPSQMRDVMEFTEERLRPERHLDTLACLYKLVNDGAFRIVAFEDRFDPSLHKQFAPEHAEEMTHPVNVDRPLGALKGLFDDVSMKMQGGRPTYILVRSPQVVHLPYSSWGNSSSSAFNDLHDYHLFHLNSQVIDKDKMLDMFGRELRSIDDVGNLLARYIDQQANERGVKVALSWNEQESGIQPETGLIKDELLWCNENGVFTLNSQLPDNGAPSTDPLVGWVKPGGYCYQKPTVVDPISFRVWRDEAYEMWMKNWVYLYPEESVSYSVIQHIHDSFCLLTLVDNDFVHPSIFFDVVREMVDRTNARLSAGLGIGSVDDTDVLTIEMAAASS